MNFSEEFKQFYLDHEAMFYNVALRWCFNQASAMDFVHDAMAELWERKHKIDREKWRVYVFSILLNKLKNAHRRNKVWGRIKDIFLVEQESHNMMNENIISQKMIERLEALPTELRSVLLMTELSGMTYKEIAEIEKIPEGTVGSRRNKALALLREGVGL